MENKTAIFLELIEKHKGVIFKITSSYCKDKDDQQDLAQEIVVQLWNTFEKYNPSYRFSTWLYRIALNTSISFYRKEKRRKTKDLELSYFLKNETEEDDEPNEKLVQLRTFIQELKEIDKAIILLYLEGLTQKEIGEIMGISSSNTGTKISRIKKSLKKKFNQ